MPRIALYARVSSEEQKEQETIQGQISQADHWLQLHPEYELVDRYLDNGVSGLIPLESRPEGKRLVDDAKQGGFSAVLIYKLDRLGREEGVTFEALGIIQKLGLELKGIAESLDDNTAASGKLVMGMKALLAAYQRNDLVERSVNGTRHWAMQGNWLGGIVPYGYRTVGTKKQAKLVVDEEEAAVVCRMFRMLAEEGKSCVQVAELLNAEGVQPHYTRDERTVGKRNERTTGYWYPSRIRGIITNSTYKGEHIYGKRSKQHTEPITRPCAAILDATIWDKARAVLQANRRFGTRDRTHHYLLRSKVRCGVCGSAYGGYTGGKQKVRYYRCNGRMAFRGRLQGHCTNHTVKAEELEEAVWERIVQWLKQPGDAIKLQAAQYNAEDGGRDIQAEIDAALAVTDAPQREKDALLVLYRRGTIGMEDLERQLQDIDREAAVLSARYEELKAAQGGHTGQVSPGRNPIT